jgi:hypothetical protein
MLILIANGIVLLVISGWVWKKNDHLLHKLYWPALSVKIVAGISLGIIYSTYYPVSDTFTFFQLAADKADLARTDFSSYLNFLFSKSEGYFLGEHRTIFYTKITSVLALITGNNYWLTTAYYSLLSFFSAWYLAKTIARIFPEYKIAACIAFLFFPSVVFWSSGVIKESLAITALFFITTVFLKLWTKEKLSVIAILLSVIAVWIIFNLKYYYLAVFIPVTVTALLARWICSVKRIEARYQQIILWMCLLLGGFFLATFLHPNFSPNKVLTIIVANNKIFMDACTPDDVIHFYNLKPTWLSMLINSPWAMISGLFRPFVWEANTIFKFITGLENLILLVLAVISLRSIKHIVLSPYRLLILSVILYCAVLSIFLALSTPNFGTLARYGVGFLPFVVLLVMNQPWITKPLSKLL